MTTSKVSGVYRARILGKYHSKSKENNAHEYKMILMGKVYVALFLLHRKKNTESDKTIGMIKKSLA